MKREALTQQLIPFIQEVTFFYLISEKVQSSFFLLPSAGLFCLIVRLKEHHGVGDNLSI